MDFSRRSLTWCEATAPAVVLGSTQAAEVVSPVAVEAGLQVVRRRSGGGAVLVEPGRLVWAELVVPAGDPLWQADVGRAGWWVGEAWARALAGAGVRDGVVHRGGLVPAPWSPLVCFAGLGPGEVTVRGRKVVGVAQRRTREGALFQCALPLAWDPRPLLDALALSPGERSMAAADLHGVVAPVAGVAAAEIEAAMLQELP